MSRITRLACHADRQRRACVVVVLGLLYCVLLAAAAQPQPARAVPPEGPCARRDADTISCHPALGWLGPPSFDERFDTFDHGTDQARPRRPHRWRTVFGYGGAAAVSNRQMSAGSFAADAGFAGMTGAGPGRQPLGLDPFMHTPGRLTILARQTPPNLRPLAWNKPYYGGAITTKFSFAQKYGYFEIEARLPTGKGMWPAFWLMPVAGAWPDAGEIDVIEGLGDPRTIFCTVIAGRHKKTTRVRLAFDAAAGFHRYGISWSAKELIWYVDRQPVARAPTPAALTTHKAYMIANLAVGGAWGGYPDATTPFPGRYEVRRITAWPHPDG
jgi:hypothetical protein